MLELRHLLTLTALRTHGSLAAAAEELHVTASAVSHQLKELENYYAVRLVNRRTRPLTFTPAGNAVLQLADAILPQVIRTKNNLKRLANGQAGRLRLASECHSCFDWLMPILNQFRRDWSDVELDFATGFEPEPHHLLSEGDIDLLITTSNLDIAGIHYQPLFTYESRLVLAPTHPLASISHSNSHNSSNSNSNRQIAPSDLTEQTLIAYPVETERLDVMDKFMAPAQLTFKNIRTTELTAMLIQLVASERGVAALPDWVAAEYEKKGWVVTRPLISEATPKGVYCQLFAATRQSSQETAFMQGFAKLLEDLVKP